MGRKGVPGVTTCGDRHRYPREAWGWLDWQREEAAELAHKAQLGTSPVIPPPGPQPSFGLFAKPSKREPASARSRAVDKLIEKTLGPR